MRTITLNRMHIANFKGIQDLEIAYDGKNTLIAGYNGTGKSTIADAYLWAVTGKNTASATRFEVRPRDEQGNEIHDVIASVECEFSVRCDDCDNFTFTVRREELEDLTKKEPEQLKPETIAKKKSFYFIDNAPFGESIYYAQLAKIICDKDKLAVLSNPFAFFALDENKQREMLTAACGDVADNEVDGYDEVKAICGAINTPTDVRDGLKKSVKATEKQLGEIPARISGLAELCDEYADYDTQIAELEKQKQELIEHGKTERAEIERLYIAQTEVLEEPENWAVKDAENRVRQLENTIAREKNSLSSETERANKSACPQCGYKLIDNSEAIRDIKNDIAAHEKELAQAQQVAVDELKKYEKASEEYRTFIAQKQAEVKERVEAIKECENRSVEYRKRYDELISETAGLIYKRNAQKQIKALRDEQRTLDAQYAEDMTKLDKVTAFIMRKASAVVENINKRFSAVKFKLFEMQTNGELKPCCKATKDGVSYANINTASKVQVGIELANLFSEYLGVVVPLWVDSRESIIDLPPTKAQTICLKVDERYKEIHIETV